MQTRVGSAVARRGCWRVRIAGDASFPACPSTIRRPRSVSPADCLLPPSVTRFPRFVKMPPGKLVHAGVAPVRCRRGFCRGRFFVGAVVCSPPGLPFFRGGRIVPGEMPRCRLERDMRCYQRAPKVAPREALYSPSREDIASVSSH